MCGYTSHHDVAMAHNIFGAGQNRHINALVERGMEIRGRPCVIEKRNYIALFGRCANGGNVLHLEGQASGRFQQYRFGTITEKRIIIGEERIKIACLDAKSLQKAIRQGSAWVIRIVGHQQDVARFENRQ